MTLWTELQELANSFPQIKAAVDQRYSCYMGLMP
jgi:hypothetical protein